MSHAAGAGFGSLTSSPVGSGPVGVGIIGAGVISKQYLDNLTSFPDVRVVAIAALFEGAAAPRANEYGIPVHGGIDAVLAPPGGEIAITLTTPAAHVEVATQAVN